jgi:predicted  nucleic acid-binding Zn-ribbon protein
MTDGRLLSDENIAVIEGLTRSLRKQFQQRDSAIEDLKKQISDLQNEIQKLSNRIAARDINDRRLQ